MVCALCAWSGSTALAVTGGSFDGNSHPYVGLTDNGRASCTGVLLSPQVLIGEAHCFGGASAYGANTATGAPIIRVTFEPLGSSSASAQHFFGSYYRDPNWCAGCGKGLPGFDAYDLAVLIFSGEGCAACAPVPASVTGGRFALLPTVGYDDSLPMNTVLTIVGYGVQQFSVGGGPCAGPCTPVPGDRGTRMRARTTLIQSNAKLSDMFLRLHANNGGFCVGDSGAPALVGETDVVAALSTAVLNSGCDGITLAYRLDTPEALAFIQSTASVRGVSLSSG
jgi:hypothetical protein